VFAHINYARQTTLKAEIIYDTLGRIGQVWLSGLPSVVPSPERGYRMRARLHARDRRLGFLLEGTHRLCDAGTTGQLLPETLAWIAEAERVMAQERLNGLVGLELAENVKGGERVCHLSLAAGTDTVPFATLAERGQLTGLSAERADRVGVTQLMGSPFVSDVVTTLAGDVPLTVQLRHHVRAFFQGNRFLLEPLVRHVAGRIPSGPVVDLYAGVGLFGLALAAAGCESVTLVEGDPISAGGGFNGHQRCHGDTRGHQSGHGHPRSAAHRDIEGRAEEPCAGATGPHCLRIVRHRHARARCTCTARWRLCARRRHWHRSIPQYRARGDGRQLHAVGFFDGLSGSSRLHPWRDRDAHQIQGPCQLVAKVNHGARSPPPDVIALFVQNLRPMVEGVESLGQ
jgi:hypothetical protein